MYYYYYYYMKTPLFMMKNIIIFLSKIPLKTFTIIITLEMIQGEWETGPSSTRVGG